MKAAHAIACAAAFCFVALSCGALPAVLFAIAGLGLMLWRTLRRQSSPLPPVKPIKGPTGARPVY